MSTKEISKLARQTGRVWGLQKLYEGIEITLLSPPESFYLEARRVVCGVDNFTWNTVNGELETAFPNSRLVYLSPDAELPPLLELLSSDIYVIGGLVDETGRGSLSREKAGNFLFETSIFTRI